MTNGFMIDQVSWHTSISGNPESKEDVIRRFYVIACFLQSNGLTTRRLVGKEEEIDDSFAISSADLTTEGLEVMRSCYDKWLQKVDEGMEPTDTSLLERSLKRIRSR